MRKSLLYSSSPEGPGNMEGSVEGTGGVEAITEVRDGGGKHSG